MNNNEQTQRASENQPVCKPDDELTLKDIFQVLFRGKKIIMLVMMITTLGALGYIASKKNIYNAYIVLKPALGWSNGDILALPEVLFGDKEKNKVMVKEAYIRTIFIGEVKSPALMKNYFSKKNSFDIGNKDGIENVNNEHVIDEMIQEMQVYFDNNNKITISADSQNKNIGLWLDGIVELANKSVRQKIVNKVQGDIGEYVKKITTNIGVVRTISRYEREDELVRLQEQYELAKKLEINNNSFEFAGPEYLKGMRFIKAEIESLNRRKSDDAYITGLRKLQEQVNFLKNFDIKSIFNDGALMVVKETAGSTTQLVAPNKKRIIALAIALGGMLGVILVFILETSGVAFIKKEQQVNKSRS